MHVFADTGNPTLELTGYIWVYVVLSRHNLTVPDTGKSVTAVFWAKLGSPGTGMACDIRAATHAKRDARAPVRPCQSKDCPT